MPRWEARRLHNPAMIQAFLERDRVYAAWALGDLDPQIFPQTEWSGAFRDGQMASLILLYKAMEPYPAITVGDVQGLAMILGSVQRTPTAYFQSREEHLAAVRGFYDLGPRKVFWRMVVRPERFRPVSGAAERLTMRNLAELERLYQVGDTGHGTARLLERGVYYGVRAMGELVATAGTHLVSSAYQVGAVGNVFTHPAHRGQGLATVVTSRVTEHLLDMGLTVVLNVEADNAAAIRVYEKLGYEMHCQYVGCLGQRRSAARFTPEPAEEP